MKRDRVDGFYPVSSVFVLWFSSFSIPGFTDPTDVPRAGQIVGHDLHRPISSRRAREGSGSGGPLDECCRNGEDARKRDHRQGEGQVSHPDFLLGTACASVVFPGSSCWVILARMRAACAWYLARPIGILLESDAECVESTTLGPSPLPAPREAARRRLSLPAVVAGG